jgi:hypothetical protein
MLTAAESLLKDLLDKELITEPFEVVALAQNFADIEMRLAYHMYRYRYYVGHQAILCNESQTLPSILAKLKANGHMIHLEIDFAMKMLSVQFREAMAEWFAKRGTAWHGSKVTWYDSMSDSYV